MEVTTIDKGLGIYHDPAFKTGNGESYSSELKPWTYTITISGFHKERHFDVSSNITEWEGEDIYETDPILRDYKSKAKTPIVKALLKLREAYIRSGKPLLSPEEIETEVKRLRGGLERE